MRYLAWDSRCAVWRFACLLLVALAAFGQGGNGNITGTITDSSGAVAPNVSIEVKNTETGAVFHGGTSNTGNYVVSVPAGQYELTVTASGFKKYVRSNMTVVTAGNTRLDVTLQVGAVSDTVTVTDQTTQVNMGGDLIQGGVNGIGLCGQTFVAVDRSGGSTNNNVYVVASRAADRRQ